MKQVELKWYTTHFNRKYLGQKWMWRSDWGLVFLDNPECETHADWLYESGVKNDDNICSGEVFHSDGEVRIYVYTFRGAGYIEDALVDLQQEFSNMLIGKVLTDPRLFDGGECSYSIKRNPIVAQDKKIRERNRYAKVVWRARLIGFNL